MNRERTFILVALLLMGTFAAPVHAQSGEPPFQETARQTIVHIVQPGETLFSIAQRHGLSVDTLTHANGIPDPRRIHVGQRLVIPGSKVNIGVTETMPYIVQAGDTMVSIARLYDTTWQTLVQINDLLSPNIVYAGQIIQVPAHEETAGKGESAREGTIYVVRPDDTLFRIALHHDISPWTLTSVSHIANPVLIYPGQELVIPGEGPGRLPTPFVSVEVQPLPVAQGTTLVITVHTAEPVALEGYLLGNRVQFGEENGTYYGLAGVHAFTDPGLHQLELRATDGQGQVTAISTGVIVEGGRFSYERIDVPASRTSLLDPVAVARDRERLDAVRYIFTPQRLWAIPFQRPAAGVVSAYFGAHRAYNGGPYTSYHSGVDFRAPTGTPVYAPAAGTVVLAEQMALWGNAVAIDHGWGVLTGYAHLSAIEVQVGQQVEPGELIAKVGNSGLSTGAHLHWEMWVGGNSVNPLQWLEESHPWPGSEQLAIGG